jgi:hypothetical protein
VKAYIGNQREHHAQGRIQQRLERITHDETEALQELAAD